MRLFVSITLLLSGFFVGGAPSVLADSTTPWQDHQGMLSTRIIAASNDVAAAFGDVLDPIGERSVLLAWEAKLEDGWKTYWRSPGEAGLPVNIYHGGKKLDILYPVPERFELFGLETYGYSKQVAIPFQIEASQGTVALSADFMVCKEICVPFKAEYQLTLDAEGDRGTIVTDTRVKTWLARVPKRFGESPDGLAIKSVSYAGKPGYQNLVVEATAAHPLTKADLLVELDETTQFHAPTMRILPDGQSARFVLDIMSTQKGLDLSGKTVRLTMSDGRGNAIDRFFNLPSR